VWPESAEFFRPGAGAVLRGGLAVSAACLTLISSGGLLGQVVTTGSNGTVLDEIELWIGSWSELPTFAVAKDVSDSVLAVWRGRLRESSTDHLTRAC
jgi:hypothetical protein